MIHFLNHFLSCEKHNLLTVNFNDVISDGIKLGIYPIHKPTWWILSVLFQTDSLLIKNE